MANIQLAKNLYTLRKSHHLTQDDLGVILSVSRQAYSNYEIGKRNPDLEAMLRLASLYQISLDELVTQNIGNVVCNPSIKQAAVDACTGGTLYLSANETQLILQYRDLPKKDQETIKDFIDSQSAL